MPGVTALRKLQLGKETVAGTAVAATAQLHFSGLWEDAREVVFPSEYTGILGGRDRNYVANLLATMEMTGEANFEELPYIFEAGILAATPTTDTGSGYIRTYTFPTTAQGSVNTYTIEGGDDHAMEEAAYSYVADFELSGKSGENWKISANWFARQVVDTDSFTPTTDVTFATVEDMLFQTSKLYIDADTDTIGTTQKANTFLEAALKVNTGMAHKFTGDGNLYFQFIKRTGFEATLEVTFEHDGTAVAEKTAWRNKTPRLIRVRILGSALTSAGAYTNKTVDIDLAGRWEKFDVIGELDGNDIVKGTFKARYVANAGFMGRIVSVTEVATLP